jgi:hypothetical protein
MIFVQDKFLKVSFCSLIFIFLCLFIPATLTRSFNALLRDTESYFAWFVVFLSSFKLTILSLQEEKKIVSITFWVYVYVFLGVTPLIQLINYNFPRHGWYSSENILKSYAIIILGLLSYEIGANFRQTVIHEKCFLLLEHFNTREVYLKRVTIFSMFAIIVTIILIFSSGGLSVLFLPRTEKLVYLWKMMNEEGQARYQIFSTLLRVPIFISLYSFAGLYISRKTKKQVFSGFQKFLIFILIILNLVTNNPFNNPRYWIGSVALAFVFLFVDWRRRASLVLVASLAAILIYIFPYSDLFRYQYNSKILDVYKSYSIENIITEKGDFDSFQQILNTVVYVNESGLEYGQQVIGTLLFWVPRSIWQTKPIPSGMLISQEIGYSNINLSLPLWGEIYLDAGLFGVILFFLLYGSISNSAETYITNKQNHPTSFISLLIPFYSAYQIFLLRGSLMSTFAYLIPVFVFLLLISGKRNRNI